MKLNWLSMVEALSVFGLDLLSLGSPLSDASICPTVQSTRTPDPGPYPSLAQGCGLSSRPLSSPCSARRRDWRRGTEAVEIIACIGETKQ